MAFRVKCNSLPGWNDLTNSCLSLSSSPAPPPVTSSCGILRSSSFALRSITSVPILSLGLCTCCFAETALPYPFCSCLLILKSQLCHYPSGELPCITSAIVPPTCPSKCMAEGFFGHTNLGHYLSLEFIINIRILKGLKKITVERPISLSLIQHSPNLLEHLTSFFHKPIITFFGKIWLNLI